MNRLTDVLVFGPHPDDAEIWSGGLVARLARLGYRVGIVDLTRGELGTRGTPEQRLAEARQAAQILGAVSRDNLGLPDGAIRSDDESRRAVVEVIRQHRPVILVAPYPEDDHPDHANAGRLVEEALFLAGLRRFAAAGEAHRAGQVWHYQCHQPFEPTFVLDVSDVFEAKMHAIRAFGSQLHREGSPEPPTNISDPSFLPKIEARAVLYGSWIGCAFGEPYFTRKPLRVRDPLAPWLGGEEAP